MIETRLSQNIYEQQALAAAKEIVQKIIDYKLGYFCEDAPLSKDHISCVVEKLDRLTNGILATQGGL